VPAAEPVTVTVWLELVERVTVAEVDPDAVTV
jgi:hypothetical protein